MTPQRVIIAEALRAARRALSAQELAERIKRDHPTIGRATVYRALDAQVADGVASRFERAGHEWAYIACNPTHHHHLVCTRCQAVEEIEQELAALLLSSVSRRHGFAVDHATLNLYGKCGRCRPGSAA